MTTPKVYVCGATGTQGGALARQLRAMGWDVHTTTRTPTSPAAQSLASIGVKLYGGDWYDETSLKDAISGCNMLFVNTMPNFANLASESDAAMNILRVAQTSGVTHVIYSSAIFIPSRSELGPDHLVNIAYGSKQRIEQAVRTWGFKHWTILRPGYFMANFLQPKVGMLYPSSAESGIFRVALRPNTGLTLIDEQDVAAFAVAAFQTPDTFHEQVIDIVGEILGADKVFEMISQATGRDIRRVYMSDDEVREAQASNPLITSQILARSMEELIDRDKIRSWGVPLSSFANFLERQKKEFEETYLRGEK
ncbi:NmrA-like family domain-containing protein 1 [Madurella mycetomatis]|uniref:NmrA-like family domain-containing protein 1 n=1 Tax=Madurella mycetomatis TaxID=100816 RepID=A0A175W3P4_9PEZI|nr:NmrA-like family domain-containing protein 1 [Madurella mycetomatis]